MKDINNKTLLRGEMGYRPIFIEIAIRESSKHDEVKSKEAPRHNQPIARKSSLKLPSDFIESAEFGKIYGFYDVTRNFELELRAIGKLYLGASFDFPSCFELSLMAISIKIGLVRH